MGFVTHFAWIGQVMASLQLGMADLGNFTAPEIDNSKIYGLEISRFGWIFARTSVRIGWTLPNFPFLSDAFWVIFF